MDGFVDRLFRRIQLLVGRGRITLVDDTGPAQMVQVRASGLELADKRVRVQEFGFTSNPPASTDVVFVSLAGDRSGSVVVGSNHQGSRPRGLKSGESKQYASDGKFIYLTVGNGIVIDAAGQDIHVQNARNATWDLSGSLTVNAPGGVLFNTPTLKSTGDIQDNCDTQDKTMAGMRQIYDGHNHDVPNVQGGTSTVTTRIPNQLE